MHRPNMKSIVEIFITRLIKGDTFLPAVEKAIVRMAFVNTDSLKVLTTFRDKNRAKYDEFRARGLRHVERNAIVQAHKNYKDPFGGCNFKDARGLYYPLDQHLSDRGLLTAEPGRDWYATHFRGGALLGVLTKVELLEGCSRDWLVAAFSDYKQFLPEALDKAGLLTQECGRDWYAAHVRGEALINVLDKAGFMTRDTPVPWFELHFRPLEKYVYSYHSDDYLRETEGGYLLHCALKAAGHLTPDLSFEWYAARFNGRVLFYAMKDGGAFGRADEKDQVVSKFKLTGSMADVIREAEYVNETKDWYARHVPKYDLPRVLKLAGLWNAELGKDWLAKHLLKKDMIFALLECGLWSAELGKDWIAKHLMKKDVFRVLLEFDLLGECTADWIRANVAKMNVDDALHRLQSGDTPEWVEMRLRPAKRRRTMFITL